MLNFFGAYLDHTHRLFGGLYHYANFGYDQCSSFDNMKVSILGAFGLKMPIHTCKIVFFDDLTPPPASKVRLF